MRATERRSWDGVESVLWLGELGDLIADVPSSLPAQSLMKNREYCQLGRRKTTQEVVLIEASVRASRPPKPGWGGTCSSPNAEHDAETPGIFDGPITQAGPKAPHVREGGCNFSVARHRDVRHDKMS